MFSGLYVIEEKKHTQVFPVFVAGELNYENNMRRIVQKHGPSAL